MFVYMHAFPVVACEDLQRHHHPPTFSTHTSILTYSFTHQSNRHSHRNNACRICLHLSGHALYIMMSRVKIRQSCPPQIVGWKTPAEYPLHSKWDVVGLVDTAWCQKSWESQPQPQRQPDVTQAYSQTLSCTLYSWRVGGGAICDSHLPPIPTGASAVNCCTVFCELPDFWCSTSMSWIFQFSF